MGAGKPILFIGDPSSEIALTIKERNIGYVFDHHDETGLVSWLSKLSSNDKIEFQYKGSNALKAALSDYSENVILSKYSRLFSDQ